MLLTFLAIGLGAGVLSGLFGIGGGIVIVPALLFFAKMSPATATGTSLGALLLPVGALGAWEYYRNGNLDIRSSMLVAVAGSIPEKNSSAGTMTMPPPMPKSPESTPAARPMAR